MKSNVEKSMLLKEHIKKANYTRGLVINTIVQVEYMLDRLLAEYFTSDNNRYEDMLLLVFSTERITLDSKRRILEVILKKWFKDQHTKYSKNLRYMENQMIPIRNRFAHSPTEYMIKNDGTIIDLIKVKDKQETISFNENQITELKENCQVCIEMMMDLFRIVRQAHPRNDWK
ncbi:hypothetical protein VRU48_16415 [Pedobacter sp. KR3-3]|uniref:MAE-28990/MAE-18760-like HEPN domain-containing protein n=1 Tax=Pedobacter albus TaxID=3113905 RepID=A0ABU7IB61_9SPHI|nr:hypothetical protein [Pedobacter sp. KR3-3]MEE1946710.1 hypothetical protein [Pedobacter sp. KR3-3]